jgi:hypothetical protein
MGNTSFEIDSTSKDPANLISSFTDLSTADKTLEKIL